jgi:hypothetical protein
MAKHLPQAPLVHSLRQLLRDMFLLREQGVAHTRYARALGYVDGYMQALIQADLANEQELLAVVAQERERVNGPGSAELTPESADVRAVA